MPRDYLPTADAELLAWTLNFSNLIGENASSFGLTTAQASTYLLRQQDYAGAYSAAFDPNTRTAPVIAAKTLAKATLSTISREYVRVVQAFPGLTDQQRKALKITVPKKRSPVPAPTARPMLEVLSVVGRTVTVNVYDSSTLTKRGKPANCVGAKLYTYVGTSYPSDPSLWAYQGDYTKAKCPIAFPDTIPTGSQVFICAAWYTRTAVGPVCMPVSANLQYGGVQQQPPMKMAA